MLAARRAAHAAVTKAELRVVLPLGHKAAYLRATGRRGPRATVWFLPDRPNAKHVLYRLLHAHGVRVGAPETDGPPPDLAIAWRSRHAMTPEAMARAAGDGTRIVNVLATDISKRTLDEAAAAALGNDVRLDPLTHVGPCVRKSDANARHDGEIINCPLPSADPAFVYQRVIDNRHGDGTVEDIRLVVVGESIPFAYLKYRPEADRFSNVNRRVELVATATVIDADEASRVLDCCRTLGLDYAEIDALRDRGDGRLYVVDANPTPYGPPNHLRRRDGEEALRLLGAAVAREFGLSAVAP